LHRGDFIDGAHNVVLIGGPGTGKTHIATAIGVQAVEHHRKRVRFFSTVELVNMLEQEKAAGRAGQIATRLHESPIPYQVDLAIFELIDHAGLREHIQRVGQPFYEA
jgi:DNA replication protein DnaC